MTVLAGIATVLGTISTTAVKFVIVDVPQAIANAGGVIVDVLSK
jgi:hypothetical protein